jgi:uncharacterized damage-inducible protein DinB
MERFCFATPYKSRPNPCWCFFFAVLNLSDNGPRLKTSMRNVISSIEGEFGKYKKLAEFAIGQLSDAELARPAAEGSNTAVNLVLHLCGNLKSRFTDFLTTDGEKPWRVREEEFGAQSASRADLLTRWEESWAIMFATLRTLTDNDLTKTVTIRGEAHRVDQALHRLLAHASYHVGQIVFIAKSTRGAGWKASR